MSSRIALFRLVVLFSLLAIPLSSGSAAVTAAVSAHIDCAKVSLLCTEVHDPELFGNETYVGHDEPSLLFYSNHPGSGNQMRATLTLPKDPPPSAPLTPGKAFNFQLHPAFWFGMAMCDTQSYPVQVSTCTPNSDRNITDFARHPGTAFMEMQFYPPGWVSWPAGNSCDATKWCAALNIDSLSEDPINGKDQNPSCQAIAGLEYVNFAFITRDGHAQAPANPVESTLATFTPDPARDLFMNSGDQIVLTMHDTAHGLEIVVDDKTTHQQGSMTASAANSFGQVKFAPSPSTECTNIPYDFHPMYSTSSEQTRVPWAAHSYNIAFADEIGHFDFCNGANPIVPGARCPSGNTEGVTGDSEPTDAEDVGCFPASASTLVRVSGCLGTNSGFDGVPYQKVWPDGNTALHPTSILFTSPLTGGDYDVNYNRIAFEADLPRIEIPVCNRTTGANCTLIPQTDDGSPANFYPFFTKGEIKDNGEGGGQSNGDQQGSGDQQGNGNRACVWTLGNDIPGVTKNDFGKNNQYGPLLQLTYLAFGGHGATIQRYNDFRQVLNNPCQAGGGDNNNNDNGNNGNGNNNSGSNG